MLVSKETRLGAIKVSSGVIHQPKDPVIVILAEQVFEKQVFCGLIFLHAGLVPGHYELDSGVTVEIPKKLFSKKHQVYRNLKLERHA